MSVVGIEIKISKNTDIDLDLYKQNSNNAEYDTQYSVRVKSTYHSLVIFSQAAYTSTPVLSKVNLMHGWKSSPN